MKARRVRGLRAQAGQSTSDVSAWMMPPAIIAFWCEFRIAPNVGGKWHGGSTAERGSD